MTDTLTRLRSDAAANREQILNVAERSFSSDGLGVSMNAIARRSGLGVATLYRHFPTKDELIAAAFSEPMAECTHMLDDALADPDPWHAFCTVIEAVFAMQALDQGFSAALVTSLPRTEFGALRERTERAFAELVRRAKEAGELRPDFDSSDLPLILMANAGLRIGAGDGAPAASRRLVAYLLQSFRAGSSAVLPPPAPLRLDASVL